MRIRLLSDLHLEGHPYYYEYAGEDVLVLAGDIHTKCRHRFFLDQIPHYVKVIMVAGNHEYYGSCYEEVNMFLYDLQSEYVNFMFLENEPLIIDDVEFFGGTMFTDMNLYGDTWKATQYAQKGIADFSWIDKLRADGIGGVVKRRWNVDDHRVRHKDFCDELVKWNTEPTTRKRVVVSHFVPHPNCIHKKWTGSPINPYFTQNMEQYMDGIDLWLFGHTHDNHDMTINNTRLVSNPRGYGKENANGFNPKLIIEV